MNAPLRILLQTTIVPTVDDWHIGRFSLLTKTLREFKNSDGKPLCEVVARDRDKPPGENDSILSTARLFEFDEVWLFAVDVGNGLSSAEIANINTFHEAGRGLLLSRDHQDLGSSILGLKCVGVAEFFHTKNVEPDLAEQCRDDTETETIDWPNYHSGKNGDAQKIVVLEPHHPLVQNSLVPGEVLEYLPAHPHEGAVRALLEKPYSKLIIQGQSLVTGRKFGIAVALDQHEEEGAIHGRCLADSSFHHFADCNWDAKLGAPGFVTEPFGNSMQTEKKALQDTQTYVRNIVEWLAPQKNNEGKSTAA